MGYKALIYIEYYCHSFSAVLVDSCPFSGQGGIIKKILSYSHTIKLMWVHEGTGDVSGNKDDVGG